MKKLLLTILVSLMWSNISNAEVIFDKWKINANEAAVRVEKLGESDLSGAFTYALLKENNKCDLMTIYFSSMSNGKYDLKELLGLKIPIKINGMGPIEAMIANTRPAFDAKTIATLDLSKEQIDSVKNLQNVTIQIGDPRPIDGYDFESVAEKIKIDFVKVDEFDPSEYFSNLSVTWDLSKNRAAVDKGRSMCGSKKEVVEEKWSDDKEGNFTLEYPSGNKYEGDVKNGKPNGYGSWTTPDGSKYIGQWKNGEQNGQGTFTFPDGTIWSGTFKDDLLIGSGSQTFPNGETYVGELKNNKPHGQGTYTNKTGATHVGQWKEGKKNGKGTFTSAEGDKLVGLYVNGKNEGTTKIIKNDGTTIILEFKNGKVVNNTASKKDKDDEKNSTYLKCEYPKDTVADQLSFNHVKIPDLKNVKDKDSFNNRDIFFQDSDFEQSMIFKSTTTLRYISENYLIFEVNNIDENQFVLNRVSLSAYALGGWQKQTFQHTESKSSTDKRIKLVEMNIEKLFKQIEKGKFKGSCNKIDKPKAQL
tara:strand:- start:76 stop:1665 length:1590 start_codon:yes stop_codon:yes gene_type:complete